MHYTYLLMAQQIIHVHLIPASFLVFTHNNIDVRLTLLGPPISSFFSPRLKKIFCFLCLSLLMNLQYLRFVRIVRDL